MYLKSTLDEAVYKELMKGFFDGSYQAGQRIDPTVISQKFGVSKTPIIQALKRMNNEGLLSCTSGGKYHIPYCMEQDVREVCYVRLLFEKEAVRYLINNNADSEIEVLEKAALECRKYAEKGEFIESIYEDLDWHKCLVSFLNNQFVNQMYMLAKNKLLAMNYVSSFKYDFQKDAASEHLEIVDCLKAKDEKRAIQLLERHIDIVKERLVEYSKRNIKE